MAIRKISEEEVMSRIELGKKVVVVVKKQPQAKLKDYIVCIKENGKAIDRGEPTFGDDPIGGEKPEFGDNPIGRGGPTFGGDPTGRGGPTFGGDPTGGETPSEGLEQEEEKKKSPLGKYIKRGMVAGLAALILLGIASTKEITHDTANFQSDYAAAVEVSDIVLINMEGKYIQYAGSVYQDPGKLIHDMRDAAIGENNGTYSGISEYFETTTDLSRVEEEEKILGISNKFQEQQSIIAENENILKSQATDEEKRAAIEKIIEAKEEIKTIYAENRDLYYKYADSAKKAYEKDGGDERTEHESEMTDLGKTEYDLAIKNLGLDIQNLDTIIYTLDNPEILFDEKPAPEGTVDTKYIVDMNIFGKDIKIGKISSTEVTGLEYDPAITVDENGTTVTNGEIVVTEKAIQETETTRKGIFAVVNIIKRAIERKETGEITVFGKQVHDDPHIEEK